jgi:hypothetical protein
MWRHVSNVPIPCVGCITNSGVVLPRAALTVLDDWGGDLTLGMRASGSNSVRITDAFVPTHHLVSLVFHGIRPEDMAEGTPGTRLHNNPMYLGRTIGPYQANLVVPIIGAARAALDEFEETIKTQKSFYDPTLLRADDAGIQLAFGEALASTAAAEAILLQGAHRYMELCYRWAKHGDLISVEDNLGLVSLFQQAGDLACDAVEGLFRSSGSFATRKGHRVVTRGDHFDAFAEDGFGQDRGGRRAVAGNVVGLTGGFFDELRTQVFIRVVELDVFGDGHAVFRHFGRAPALIEHRIAAAGAERAADGSGELGDARQQRLPAVVLKNHLLCHVENPPGGRVDWYVKRNPAK